MNLFDQTLNTIATNKKYHFPIFFGVLLFLTSAMMFFYHPLRDGHDFFFHKMRIEALMEAIENGNFPLYIDHNAIAGYGYLAKVFYSDLLLIPFAIVGVFTNFTVAYQTMVFTITILCGVFTYIAVNKVYKSSYAASISGIIYTFCIYRLLDLYHRSAIGETVAMTILPIVFLGLYYIIAGDYKKWYVFTIGFCLLIYSHTISSVMTFIFVVILLLIYIKRFIKEPKRIFYLVLSGIVSLPLLVYYFLPMIEQTMSNTFYFETNPILRLHDAKYTYRLAMWGITNNLVTLTDQHFMVRTGIVLTCAICLRMFVYQKNKLVRSADILVLLGLLCILTVTPMFPWNAFPLNKLNFIQFPWRFYEFTSFFWAVAGGFYASQAFRPGYYRRFFILGSLFFVASMIILGTDWKNFAEMNRKRNISPIGNVENHFNIGMGKEYLPSKVPSLAFIDERREKIESQRGISTVQDTSKDRGITSFMVATEGQDVLELPLIYYKGYKATLNGKEIPISESDNGLLQVSVTESGRVEAWYAGTTIQRFSWYFSLISMLVFSIYIFLSNRRQKKNAAGE